MEIGHMLGKTDILMVNIIEMWVFHDIKPSNQFQRSISFLPSCSLENKEILELKMAVLQLNRYGLFLRFRYWKLKWDKRFAGQIIFWSDCKRRVSNKSNHRYNKPFAKYPKYYDSIFDIAIGVNFCQRNQSLAWEDDWDML